MRKTRLIAVMTLLIFITAGFSSLSEALIVEAATAAISDSSVVLTAGKTKKISVKNAGKGFTWTSSNKTVATVTKKTKNDSTAVITAKGEGVAVITATKGKNIYQCTVAVLNKASTKPDGETATESKTFRNISVFETKGTNSIKRSGKNLSTVKDMKLKNNDYGTVGKDGMLRLCFNEDTYAYFEENTEFAVSKGWFNKIKVAMTKGEMIIEVRKKLTGDDSFNVITPNTNMAIRGTVVAVKTEILKDGSVKTTNYVLAGTATLTFPNTKKKAVTLKAGEGMETTTDKKGKLTERKKTDASGLSFTDIDTKKLKGADGEKIIIKKDKTDDNTGADNNDKTLIQADSKNFPDDNFRKYILEYIDKDKDGRLSQDEIDATWSMTVSKMEIADLTGVGVFTALTTLSCDNNLLTSLDMSKNTALSYLDCSGNLLTDLNVSKNAELTYLYCHNNQITDVKIGDNTALTILACGSNPLAGLDVRSNSELTELYCSSDQLNDLDLTNNPKLTVLNCSINNLSSLDISRNPLLTELQCGFNDLRSLDLKNNKALTKLSCYYNKLTNLDVSGCPADIEIDADSNVRITR